MSPKPAKHVFIAHQTNRVVGSFTGRNTGSPDTLKGAPDAQHQCTSATRRLLKRSCQSLTVTCSAPDAEQVGTGRVRCTPDSCAESSANSQGHRTQATGRTLSVRCTPDPCAERVAKRPHTGRAPPDAQASVRCLSSGALP